jgi:Tfp pilus assembly protein PilN
MMLEINLLPGAKKGKSAAGNFSLGSLSALGAGIRDPWLIGAAASVVIAVATVGLLFSAQSARATEVDVRMERAVRDSTRYAKVLAARRKLTAERDSVMRQLQIIRTIDDNRYVWAHLLDEISSALPQYTWLVSVEQTSKPTLPPGAQPAEPTTAKGGAAARAEAKAAGTPAGKAAAAKAAAAPQDSIVIHQPVAFRVIGQTVDMQALTQFMKDLEASPFVKNVMLMKSEIVVVDTKDITQFSIEAEFEVAPKELLTTEALVVPVR